MTTSVTNCSDVLILRCDVRCPMSDVVRCSMRCDVRCGATFDVQCGAMSTTRCDEANPCQPPWAASTKRKQAGLHEPSVLSIPETLEPCSGVLTNKQPLFNNCSVHILWVPPHILMTIPLYFTADRDRPLDLPRPPWHLVTTGFSGAEWAVLFWIS